MKSANVTVEAYWPSLFAKLAEKRNLDDLILNAGSGGCAAPAAVSAPAGGAGSAAPTAAAVEEKKVHSLTHYTVTIDFAFAMSAV